MGKCPNHLGETALNIHGELMKIVRYEKANDINVEFQDKFHAIVHTRYDHFRDGEVRNPYYKHILGVACTGLPRSNITSQESYCTWYDMIRRCYDESYLAGKPTYENCSVCEDWLIYTNFKEWYDNNYYKIDDCVMQLDKDILDINNTHIYCPDNCVFVNNEINSWFSRQNKADKGIQFNSISKKFYARCHQKRLGAFETKEEALQVYNYHKGVCIQELADILKDKIPERLYNGLIYRAQLYQCHNEWGN